MVRSTPSPTFNQPDLRILHRLNLLQWLALLILTLLAATVLCGWLLPPIGRFLPSGWALMKVNTAILVLLSGLSTLLTQSRRPPPTVRIGRLLGAFVALVAVMSLAEYASGRQLGLDTLFAADSHALFPGRMSIQTALSFLSLGIVLLTLHARKGMTARIADAGALLLCLQILIYAAGYLFDASALFGVSRTHLLSPQTLLCLVLLTLIVFSRRMESGAFSILIDDGIGGKTARLAAPFLLSLPFALAEFRSLVMRFNLMPEQYGVALSSAALALVGFCFVVFLARRCQELEAITLELSFRDQLTHIYNRRGFFLFAEQSLRVARRNKMEFFLLVIDMDNLKKVNDNLGHAAGSKQIRQMAQLLQNSFRDSDVIGRIGGDEFVVAGNGTARNLTDFAARLELAATAEQLSEQDPYPLSFSLGQITAPGDSTETLEALIRQADTVMYEMKRTKKASRATSEHAEPALLYPPSPHRLPIPA